MKTNKKGQAVISNIFGYFLLFVLTIIFWIIASHIKNDIVENTLREAAIDNSKTNLLLFLREPTYYEGKQHSVSELVIEGEYDYEKRATIKKIIEKRFNKKYGNFWNLKITYPKERILQYGYEYTTKKKVLRGGPHAGEIAQLSGKQIIEKALVVTTILPGYESENIEITFENWILI
ncbi:MAG: hypothetical protein H8D38_04685 [DPANN group archaeon]|nr:hypothetical protein [DPANN group archaeon]